MRRPACSTSWSIRRTAKSTTGTPSSKASAGWRPASSPAGSEALEGVRDAPDVGYELALQPDRGVGGEIDLDRVGKAAVSGFDRLRDLIIGAASGEDADDFVRDLSRHLGPSALDRHSVQFEPELVEPVQRQDRQIAACRAVKGDALAGPFHAFGDGRRIGSGDDKSAAEHIEMVPATPAATHPFAHSRQCNFFEVAARAQRMQA